MLGCLNDLSIVWKMIKVSYWTQIKYTADFKNMYQLDEILGEVWSL